MVYQLAAGSSQSSSTLTLSTWTQVLAQTIVFDPATMPNGQSALGGLYFGTTQTYYNYISTTLSRNDLQNDDVVKIGGFIGQISDFRIFTPTAIVMNNRKIIFSHIVFLTP